MKKNLVIALLSCTAAMNLFAREDQTLSVYYIAKDYSTETSALCRELKDIYSFALRDPSQAAVFYLPNSTSPQIVRVNLPGDNRKEFDHIMDALVTRSETIIDPAVDLNALVNLFNQVPLTDDNGNYSFLNVELFFYITPSFWDLGYNEQIIASTYFALDFEGDWAKGYCSMSIYHNANDGLTVDGKVPFGVKNLCKDYKFYLMTYGN